MSNSATIENLATIQQDKDIKNEEVAIKVENLSKIYRLYDTPLDRLKESLHPFKKKYHREFYALRDVNFEVKRGETVGIIGKNGSGKSTLLKIITGVLTPTSGNVTINGKVSALLELGTGFNPEYTGIENIYFSGTIMGYTKEEIDKKIDEIVAFADIGDFIKQPVKTYSSGMYVRLAFAVAINIDPDILIIDEALSVGDMVFQAKSIQKMRELIVKSTLIFVSHSLEAIRSICKKAILMDKGKIYAMGDVKSVTEIYEKLVNQMIADNKKFKSLNELAKKNFNQITYNNLKENCEDPEFEKKVKLFRSGTGEAKFIRAELLVDGKSVLIVPFGAKVILRLLAKYYFDINTEGTIGYMIRNDKGIDVFGMNIYNLGRLIPSMKSGQILEAEFSFNNLLATAGTYSVSIGLKEAPIQPVFLDCVNVAIVFEVPAIEHNYVPGLLHIDNDLKLNIL